MFVVSLSYSERAVALAENKLLVKPRFLTVGFDLLVIITIALGNISFSLEDVSRCASGFTANVNRVSLATERVANQSATVEHELATFLTKLRDSSAKK